MSDVDCFDGSNVRRGGTVQGDGEEEDLPIIHPVVDGRLKDEGRVAKPAK
jgi:hypothetical protein